MPAITINRFGIGTLVNVGTLLRAGSLDAFVAWLTGLAGVAPILPTPAGAHAYKRQSADFRLVLLLNFSELPHLVGLGATWQDVLTGQELDQVNLPPAGVAVLMKAR